MYLDDHEDTEDTVIARRFFALLAASARPKLIETLYEVANHLIENDVKKLDDGDLSKMDDSEFERASEAALFSTMYLPY